MWQRKDPTIAEVNEGLVIYSHSLEGKLKIERPRTCTNVRRHSAATTLGLPVRISTSTARPPSPTPVNLPLPRLELRDDFAAIQDSAPPPCRLTTTVDVGKKDKNLERRQDETAVGRGMVWGDAGTEIGQEWIVLFSMLGLVLILD